MDLKLWSRKGETPQTVQGDDGVEQLRQKLAELVQGPLGFIIVRARGTPYEVSFGGGVGLNGCFCYVRADGLSPDESAKLPGLDRFSKETASFAGSDAYRAWFGADEVEEAVAVTQRIFEDVFHVRAAFEVKEDPISAIENALTGGQSVSMAVSSTTPLSQVPLSKLIDDEANVRHEVGDLSDLRASISADDLLHPLVVRPRTDRGEGIYGVIAGKRRWMTLLSLAQERGQSLDDVTVNVRIRPMDDVEALLLSLKENLARHDLTPREMYDVFERLKQTDKDRFNTYEQLGQAIGKDRQYVERIYAAVRVELDTGVPVVRQARRKPENGKREVPLGHAQRLEETLRALNLPDHERRAKMQELVEAIRKMSRRSAETLLDRFRAAPDTPIAKLRQQILAEGKDGHMDPFPHGITSELVDESLKRAATDYQMAPEVLRGKIVAHWLHRNRYLAIPRLRVAGNGTSTKKSS
jgi:ParB/RepB/Spo0J family partition protein